MNRIAGQIAETIRILNEAYNTWNPSTVVACFSGGDDSAVMTHVAVQWAKEKGISLVTMAADTLISADGWREYVTDAAAKIGATLIMCFTPGNMAICGTRPPVSGLATVLLCRSHFTPLGQRV